MAYTLDARESKLLSGRPWTIRPINPMNTAKSKTWSTTESVPSRRHSVIQYGAFQTRPALFNSTIATPSDLHSVARLCRRAVGPSDYVLRILPRAAARGRLFLAWYGNELVGMTLLDKCLDGSGWLSMARTDPGWRRQGVAIFLQRRILEYARGEGINSLRLWTLSTNQASIRACEKGGFKQVSEAAHISRRLKISKNRKTKPNSVSTARLRSLLSSNYIAKTNGYIARDWYFMKSSERLLRQLERRGELYDSEDYAFLVTRPEIRFKEPQSSLTILTGPVSKSMESAQEIAAALGAKILSSYIPYEPYQFSVAKKQHFRRSPWGNHCLVFEKKV